MAKELEKFVLDNKLFTEISNKNYVHVEGWQFAGALMGLVPIITSVESVTGASGEIKYRATSEIINMATDKVVGRGFAICSNKENKKKAFDEYAIFSMAQTRSIGKGYRNLVGWVMKLAGYEGTPSEEMTKVGEVPPTPPVIPQVKVVVGEIKEILCHGFKKSGCPDGKAITPAQEKVSMHLYKKPLCRNCFSEMGKIKK